ncbi:XRE family transcriptional regulator [Actinospica durhamensis]|uniref:XRE family transcriptional regulator n=1 Tax=Actinospica durhamensis TaxID=1508375 RepID=A0A941ETJ3_9ACTN|nr:XRE family transcriptional regulator [Actinospica durhamensis]MBR7836963.1 XRE family transcriptional regulator [Actinospica durhamensis]
MLKTSATSSGELVNETLRSALAHKGLDQLGLASALQVDPKTVERWLAGRTPHPRSRVAIAKLLDRTEAELWPDVAINRDGPTTRFGPEIRAVYPHRYAVPRQVWYDLFAGAEQEIDILVYSGLFLFEDTRIVQLLTEKAQAGVRTRVLLGHPDSPAVAQRGEDERIGDSVAGRIRNALSLVSPLAGTSGVTLRLHNAGLYTSVCRADDELIATPHIYGVAGAAAPTFCLRKLREQSLFMVYLDSLDQVWSKAEMPTHEFDDHI